MTAVSVVIPCYKDAATLGRAIESVLVQTYSPIEVVVVNDCSPESDAIEAVLGQFPTVRYVRNPSNVGLAGTRNAGIEAATGRYLALLDADDEYHPEKIAAQMAAISPGAAVTCGVMHAFGDGRREPGAYVSGGERVFTRPEQIHYRNSLNGAGLLIERDLLRSHGAFDETLRSCEDFDLWLRLLGAGVLVKDIGKPLYIYHANPEGLSKNYLNISKWEIEVIQRYTRRMGRDWARSRVFGSVASAWVLRQVMRSELTRDGRMRALAVESLSILNDFPMRQAALRLAARLRLLYLPARFLQLLGGLRST